MYFTIFYFSAVQLYDEVLGQQSQEEHQPPWEDHGDKVWAGGVSTAKTGDVG